ncbi:MAG: leucyl/phenylalanyl-tRNA--protein transferase [Bdellovibrionota bacterium]
MAVKSFPDPRQTTEEGILALGGDLEPETLLLAYRQGIFPWPIEGYPLAWFCPPKRAVLELERLHIPRSLAKVAKKTPFRFTIDQAFDEVIAACAEASRPGQPGTWITPEMLDAYRVLHRLGRAHSVEAWEDQELVGGIYGVDAGGAFAGESMFFRKPYASKLALLHLLEHLRARGLEWIDIQMLTPHMEALGAREISRDAFLRKLSQTQARGLTLF